MIQSEEMVKSYIEASPYIFETKPSANLRINNDNKFFLKILKNDNVNSFYEIYDFIVSNLISKYDELVSCDYFYENQMEDVKHQFYVRYNKEISFDKRNELHYSILNDIYGYCKLHELIGEFKEITILLIKSR